MRGSPWFVAESRVTWTATVKIYEWAYNNRFIFIEPPEGSPYENAPFSYRVVPYGLDKVPMDLSVPDPDDLDIVEGLEKYYVVLIGEEVGVWNSW